MSAINICICTCRRTQLLRQCLDSVAEIQKPENASATVTVTVTVIDNDTQQSARLLIESLSAAYPFQLTYVVETRRGIPFARNRAIEETHNLGADYLVFIDDDEWVQKSWLVELFNYCQLTGGNAVVAGGVIPELPADLPEHVRSLFEGKTYKTGDRLESCATNNVIIPVKVTRDLGLRFDESDPLAGGTDTIFFVEAAAKGVDIFRCAEALVHESVPLARANLRWLSRRKYRAGITEAWRKKKKGRSKVRILSSALVVTCLHLFVAGLVLLVNNKAARNKYWLKACKYWGVAAGAVGVKVDSYRKIDGC